MVLSHPTPILVSRTIRGLKKYSNPKMGAAVEADYTIKPENTTPAISMSEFPLLLKNYDKREVYLCDRWEQYTNNKTCSSCTDKSFHTHPFWLRTPRARPEIVYLIWGNQPRQTLKSFQPRSRCMGQTDTASGKDWTQWNAGPQSHWLPHRVYRSRNSSGEVTTRGRKRICVCHSVAR